MEDTMGPRQQRLNRCYKFKTLEAAKIGQSKESLSLQRKRWPGRHLDFISEAYCKEKFLLSSSTWFVLFRYGSSNLLLSCPVSCLSAWVLQTFSHTVGSDQAQGSLC